MSTLILVVGSGRSGTSLVTSLLARAGAVIPGPEVPPDPSNPRGFGEPQWVVDLHNRLLHAGRLVNSDPRPVALVRALVACQDARSRSVVRDWLAPHLASARAVVVKDPRLHWLLPLWVEVGHALGAEVRAVIPVRDPLEVIHSKVTWYGTGQPPGWDDDFRLAAWINGMLHAEAVTRDLPRTIVGFDALVSDPAGAGGALIADVGPDLMPPDPAALADLVDPTLVRSARPRIASDVRVSPLLLDLAERIARGLAELSARNTDPSTTEARRSLDGLRSEYFALYSLARSITPADDERSSWHAPRGPVRARLHAALRGLPQRSRSVRSLQLWLRARNPALEARLSTGVRRA